MATINKINQNADNGGMREYNGRGWFNEELAPGNTGLKCAMSDIEMAKEARRGLEKLAG